MNVWNKFRSTHFVQYFWNISLRTTIINLMVELEEMLGDHQSHLESASSGGRECLYNISWQLIQYLPRYFYLDRSGGKTD